MLNTGLLTLFQDHAAARTCLTSARARPHFGVAAVTATRSERGS